MSYGLSAMTLRPSIWPSSKSSLCQLCRFCQLSVPSRVTRHDRQFMRFRPALGRRYLASSTSPAAASAITQDHLSSYEPAISPSRKLNDLLEAVQSQDLDATVEALAQWTAPLQDPESPEAQEVVEQVDNLPATTLSEILRSLDPFLTANQQVGHGMYIAYSETQVTGASKLVDEFGIRRHHRRVFDALLPLMYARSASSHGLQTHDFEVFMRCCGAALDSQGANDVFSTLIYSHEGANATAKTHLEFLKARFVIDPMYFQYDRARVALRARDMHGIGKPIKPMALWQMDRLRYSLNSRKRNPWGRDSTNVSTEMQRMLRRRRGGKSGFDEFYRRTLEDGFEMDEEFLCTAMVAYSRAFSFRIIKEEILGSYYGIEFTGDGSDGTVRGGVDFPPDSLIKPTVRLLDAIAEAFGCMAQIPLAMKLIDFISRRYEIPIPARTWSNLLGWTYISASKPFSQMHRLRGEFKNSKLVAGDIGLIWSMMTSEPYNVSPSFEDYDNYVRSLIICHDFDRALHIIRNDVLPYYSLLVQELHRAVADEVLQLEAGPCPQATLRRRKAERLKDHVHHRITMWFVDILKTIQHTRAHDHTLTCTTIPGLVREFGDFFGTLVSYRVANGYVDLYRDNEAVRRFHWRTSERTILPTKLSRHEYKALDGATDPDTQRAMMEAWPEVDRMNVRDKVRVPRLRNVFGVRVPRDSNKGWWSRLEKDLLL